MLQQARQRADVLVRDVCPTRKKIVTSPSRVSTSTNNPTATKNTLVPMDVSQMSWNVAKSETEEQESPSHSWDNSWYHSNWHGKAYGLEVDPWAAVEFVPYLCAVS